MYACDMCIIIRTRTHAKVHECCKVWQRRALLVCFFLYEGGQGGVMGLIMAMTADSSRGQSGGGQVALDLACWLRDEIPTQSPVVFCGGGRVLGAKPDGEEGCVAELVGKDVYTLDMDYNGGD